MLSTWANARRMGKAAKHLRNAQRRVDRAARGLAETFTILHVSRAARRARAFVAFLTARPVASRLPLDPVTDVRAIAGDPDVTSLSQGDNLTVKSKA